MIERLVTLQTALDREIGETITTALDREIDKKYTDCFL